MNPDGIPSPPSQWRSFNIGEWLRDLGLDWFTLNLVINAYAAFILIGIGVALWLTNRRLVARGAEPWVVLDIALWAVPLGILGGRLYHVATHPADYFYEGADLLRIFYVWEGGLAILGAVSLGAVGAYIGARSAGLRFSAYADALAPGLLLAQGIGRTGNYFNQELFGAPTDLPWGLQIDRPNSAIPVGLPDDTLFHPTFAYEMLWNLLGALVLIWVGRKLSLQWGRLFALYLVWYGIGRAFLETIRLDPAELILGVRVNVWGALLAIVLGIALYVRQGRRHPGAEPGPYLPGREWKPESEVHSEDDYFSLDDVDVDMEKPAGR
ncbi:MAG: prolipoprotein diacylglyceryl transferase, partial [Microbacteriaceae bacterium]|nr:prolipoprotein diacylglyceryl transferase [Microbacteriaceae bacterium]